MRLEVTRKSDLAVRALVVLHDAGRRLKAPELAEHLGASAGFMSQVMNPLVRAGWVRSDAGPTGGYSLAASLADLTLLDVIERIEGPVDDGQCVLADRPCEATTTCALHDTWTRVREHLVAELRSQTLADVVDCGNPTAGADAPRPDNADHRIQHDRIQHG